MDQQRATRSEALQRFFDAASAAFGRYATSPEAKASTRTVFDKLAEPESERVTSGRRLPVCDTHLEEALQIKTNDPLLRDLLESFEAIEPMLEWRTRPDNTGTASDNFADGHANAMVFGPAGLEHRQDAWLGVSLLGPNVRYPDHDHAPEETYLVMSDGEFRQDDGPWFSPGVGGSFFNTAGIQHAMRSNEKPLFAFWALLPEQDRTEGR